MKKLLAVAFGLTLGTSAFGQGTILLQNLGPGLSSPVGVGVDTPVSLIPAGNLFWADFLVGTDPSSLSPIPGVTRTFAVPGYFGLGAPEVVLPGFAAGSHPWFQVRVWDDSGVVGQGQPFQLVGAGLGNSTSRPPIPGGPLLGMPYMWVMIPEPATNSLLVLGASSLLLLRRRK